MKAPDDAGTTAQELLESVERQVRMPVPASRRHRFWLAWLLWGVFGAAVTLSGAPEGAALVLAGILTAPLWLLFAAWPFLWVADRLRSRRLWARDVRLVVADGAGRDEVTAVPVIVGRDGRVVVPLEGWRAVFTEPDPVRLGVGVLPAGTLPGVALDAMEAQAMGRVLEEAERVPGGEAAAAARWIRNLLAAA